MLRRLQVVGFKSLSRIDVAFPSLTVLFGPNAAGKSNLLDAVQALSRIGTCRTLTDALSDPIRGHPMELFAFPSDGLPGLLAGGVAGFTIQADLAVEKVVYRYRIHIEIQPDPGRLSVRDEYLGRLGRNGEPVSVPMEVVEGRIRLRRRGESGRPRYEELGGNYALLSDSRLGAPAYAPIERVRGELSSWRTYYLDPRNAMRASKPPSEAKDIGVLGEDIAPFLYRLKSEAPGRFESVRRTLRSLIPGVEDLSVDLDKRRGTLDIQVRQQGVSYSSRIVSEGTLRVLALCALTVNPWGGGLLAFEEPENGVHPRRIDLIARLLASLARTRQVIVTTHSPVFCNSILRIAREGRDPGISLLNVHRTAAGTEATPFRFDSPLFHDQEILRGLTAPSEDAVFEGLLMRGGFDEGEFR